MIDYLETVLLTRSRAQKGTESSVTFQELDLTRRQGKHGQLLQLIDRARTQALLDPEELVRLSHVCREPPCSYAPAAKAALTAALQLMRSQPQQPPPIESMASVSPCFTPCCTCCKDCTTAHLI